jgi:hypothetical protein
LPSSRPASCFHRGKVVVALTPRQARAAAASVDGVPAPPPAPSYPSTPWEVVELSDGLVLLVNTTKGPLVRPIADDIYRYYGSPT